MAGPKAHRPLSQTQASCDWQIVHAHGPTSQSETQFEQHQALLESRLLSALQLMRQLEQQRAAVLQETAHCVPMVLLALLELELKPEVELELF